MLSAIPPRDDRGMSTMRTVSVMALISVFCGVLVAGLLIPVASLLGMGTNSVADGFKSLPLALREQPTPERSEVKDRNGNTIAYFYKQNRHGIPLDKVAPVMQDAILAIEDYRFYEHGPLDVQGTARAFVSNALGNPVQGGSSITQQLVKMILVQQADTDKERLAATDDSYGRKLRELKYAMAYEQNHTKKEILEKYLNTAYFGDGAYGIDAAARHYFSVPPAKLDAREAATLAGLVKNPVAYDPTRYPQEAITRRNTVLDRMADLGKIDEEKANKLIGMPLFLHPTQYSNGCVSTVAPFYCDYVRRYLLQDPALGDSPRERAQVLDQGGLTIETNLDQRFQRAGDRAVKSRVGATDNAIGAQAMVEPGTGEVRALAQSRPMGRDVRKGETYLNYTVPKRFGGANGFQAGSTFKAFTAAAALEAGYPTSTFFNSPQSIVMPQGSYKTCDGDVPQDWPVTNSTGAGGYPMSIALPQSVNTYFAQLESLVGLCRTIKMAHKMGIGSFPEHQEVGPFTLGVIDVSPLEMAAAYATLPARGMACEPHPVSRILDRDGDVFKTYEPECERAMSKAAADSMNQMLSYVQSPSGFGASLMLDQPSAAKTGTTTDNQAVWYMGYTPNLVTSSMIAGANDSGTQRTLVGVPLHGVPLAFDSIGGSSLAGPMWYDSMRVIQKWLPNRGFRSPSGLGPTPDDTPVAPPPDTDNGDNGNNNGNGNNGNNRDGNRGRNNGNGNNRGNNRGRNNGNGNNNRGGNNGNGRGNR